jgi:hypothetical protein
MMQGTQDNGEFEDVRDAGFVVEMRDPRSNYGVVIDEDHKVAYAYLKEGERTVGDVWLYNVRAAPETPEWDTPENAPFMNPRGFALAERPRSYPDARYEFRWLRAGEAFEGVEIVIDGVLIARLKPGSKPGWSRYARKDGPVAKRLSSA